MSEIPLDQEERWLPIEKARTAAEHIWRCSQIARDPKWKQIYKRRYQHDETYFDHEHVAIWYWIRVRNKERKHENTRDVRENQEPPEAAAQRMLSSTYDEWFKFGMPTWWVTRSILAMIRDMDSRGDRLLADELPDDVGVIMVPRSLINIVGKENNCEAPDAEIIAISFLRVKSGVFVGFDSADSSHFVNLIEFSSVYERHPKDKDGAILPSIVWLAIRLIQIIHDAKPTIKESTEQSPAKLKHGEWRPALWSRRMVGEGFVYTRKPHQGGSHRPPRLHRRRAHTKGVWVGAHSTEERHIEERNIPATWVADGSLTPEEKAQLIGLLGGLVTR